MTAQAQPARSGARAVSYLVDLIAVLAAGAITWPLARSWVIAGIVVLEAGVVLSLARATTGRSPGAWTTRTIAHTADAATTPGLARQSVRSLIIAFLQLSVVGPLITALASRGGRDWVDRVSGTAVADLRPRPQEAVLSRDPYGRATTARTGVTRPAARPAPPPAEAPAPARRAITGEPAAPSSPPRLAFVHPATPPAPPPAPVVGPVPAPAGTESTPAWIVIDSGVRIEVDKVIVLGREPEATDAGERAVVVPDPSRSLSRTHLRVGVDAGGIWVEDAFSANGTTCRTPDGSSLDLPRGRRTVVPAGTVVVMGDRTLTLNR